MKKQKLKKEIIEMKVSCEIKYPEGKREEAIKTAHKTVSYTEIADGKDNWAVSARVVGVTELPVDTILLKDIKAIRNKLPDNWKWNKVYELPYVSLRTGREFYQKHWAVTALDGKGLVCSLGLISHDHSSDRKHFMDDIPVQFVEKSLTIIDSLLTEIERLQACR